MTSTINDVSLRQFTTADWYAFAGASPLTDASPPRIFDTDGYSLVVSGAERGRYVGKNGNAVDVYDADGKCWSRSFIHAEAALAFAEALCVILMAANFERLYAMLGFERIN